jgi:hypothetical protein
MSGSGEHAIRFSVSETDWQFTSYGEYIHLLLIFSFLQTSFVVEKALDALFNRTTWPPLARKGDRNSTQFSITIKLGDFWLLSGHDSNQRPNETRSIGEFLRLIDCEVEKTRLSFTATALFEQ